MAMLPTRHDHHGGYSRHDHTAVTGCRLVSGSRGRSPASLFRRRRMDGELCAQLNREGRSVVMVAAAQMACPHTDRGRTGGARRDRQRRRGQWQLQASVIDADQYGDGDGPADDGDADGHSRCASTARPRPIGGSCRAASCRAAGCRNACRAARRRNARGDTAAAIRTTGTAGAGQRLLRELRCGTCRRRCPTPCGRPRLSRRS